VATKGRADGILRLSLPGEPMLGLFMVNYYKNNGDSGSISFNKVLEKAVSDLRSTGCTLIPDIEKREDTETKENADTNNESGDDGNKGENTGSTDKSGDDKKSIAITLGGSAVIKDYKLCGWLDDLETRGFEWVMGNCRDAEVTAFYENGYLPLKVYGSKPVIRFSRQNGKLVCTIHVKVSGAIHEHDFDDMELYAADSHKLEPAFEQVISKEITQTADKLKDQMGADVYNFKDMLRKKNFRLYQSFDEDWQRHFREMEIIPDVKVDIISIGIIK